MTLSPRCRAKAAGLSVLYLSPASVFPLAQNELLLQYLLRVTSVSGQCRVVVSPLSSCGKSLATNDEAASFDRNATKESS